MLRLTLLLLAGVFAFGTAAEAADADVPARKSTYKAARQLPPGLPRAGYGYRTTVAPVKARRERLVDTDEGLLLTEAYGPGGYIKNLPGTPILLGSSTIPGYYGRAYSYDYQGPYYGGPYQSYLTRLPYACGVYGYC